MNLKTKLILLHIAEHVVTTLIWGIGFGSFLLLMHWICS